MPTRPIDRLTAFPPDFDPAYRQARKPLIVSAAMPGWPASRWTPRSLKVRYGEVETSATVQLPREGVVYLQNETAHRRTLALGEFIDLMESGACCYIDQAAIERFPGLAEDCPVYALVPAGRRIANLWIGAGTRSGLHYDPMDNYLVQAHGTKTVFLAAPGDRRDVYPFPDNVAKSRIDPENPDTARFPRAARVTFLTGRLEPGELLYIPRGWWHFLRAPEESVSVNLWHDPALTVVEELGAIFTLGPACWARVARDFAWHGIMRRPYERRLYSPPPTGKQLYDVCAMMLAGKSVP